MWNKYAVPLFSIYKTATYSLSYILVSLRLIVVSWKKYEWTDNREIGNICVIFLLIWMC